MILDLVQRIQEELAQIKRAKGLAIKRWKKALIDPDYLASVTLDLLNFYSGMERIFARTIYSFQLNPQKIKPLITSLPLAYKLFERDLNDFISKFLLKQSVEDKQPQQKN